MLEMKHAYGFRKEIIYRLENNAITEAGANGNCSLKEGLKFLRSVTVTVQKQKKHTIYMNMENVLQFTQIYGRNIILFFTPQELKI